MIIHLGKNQYKAEDCQHWHLKGTDGPACSAGHDVSKCGGCQHRKSREGNWRHPPVVLRVNGGRPTGSHKRPNASGLGDVVARALEAVGIRKRKGCKCGQRQATLNRWFPFGKKK